MKEFYVYGLFVEGSTDPFYIGKGKGRRATQHLRDARLGKCKNKHLENKILQTLRSSTRVIHVLIFETSNENEAFDVEKQLIEQYGRVDIATGILLNLTSGGEGVRNRSQEAIQRNTESAKLTKLSWSDQKRDEASRNASQAMKEFWGNLSVNEVMDRTKHLRTRWCNMSESEREVFSQKCRERHAAYNTQEWKERIRSSCKRLWSEDRRRQHGLEVSARIYAMDEQKRNSHRENVRSAVRNKWERMTTQERNKILEKGGAGISKQSPEKASKTRREKSKSETVADRERRIRKHIDAASKVDWSTVSKKVNKKKSEWSEDRKKEYSEKMRQVALKRWGKK